jgi:methionyl aminopeptidase
VTQTRLRWDAGYHYGFPDTSEFFWPKIGGKGPKIKKGYVFAVEPMINLGVQQTKTLKDGWTVVTVDGQPSAHVEHTIAITEEGPEVLTLVGAGSRLPAELAGV